MQACSAETHDCSCKDVSYEICHTPPAAQELHVGTLEECIQNCDLFGSFGQCNYLLYWESGPDENCKLIADTTLDQYLEACRVVGQPLRDAYGVCVSGFLSKDCSLIGCDDCHVCDADDACGLYSQTECLKIGSPGETSENIPSFEHCLALCTSQQQSNKFTYVVYDKEQQECICYPDGLRECQITAVPFGMTLDQALICDGCESNADCPAARPICSVQTHRCVECEKKSDCSDPSKPICDLNDYICIEDGCSSCVAPTDVCDPNTGACIECLTNDDCTDGNCDTADNVCKPECHVDTDCNAQDYCKCHDGTDVGNSCPAGGDCVLGCRDVGTACATEDGDCNGDHGCVVVGDTTLTKLTIETKECTGCSSLKAVSGATINMTAIPPPPSGEKTCSTAILDNPASIDYSSQAVFELPAYLSKCFFWGYISDLTKFQVTWTGPGTWTPEKFTLERKATTAWPICCFNDAGLTVSEVQPQEFTCVESSQATYGMDCKP